MRLLHRSALATFVLLTACASAPAPEVAAPVSPPAADSPARPAETAPRPFTAAQIRDAMPKGHVLRIRMEAAGAAPTVEVWTVLDADADTMTLGTQIFGEDGALREDRGSEVARWTELVEHAAFPAASTVRTEGRSETPLGLQDTLTYEVTRPGEDGVAVVARFVFARAYPGPPVEMTLTRQGVLIRRMTVLERR